MLGEQKLKQLIQESSSKIIMIIMDGLGDTPNAGKTSLEEAHCPNLDKLAQESELGLTMPVSMGITPGSGPAHLSAFGYDPLEHEIGRGVLEALGIGLELGPDDLAVRANFCTLNSEGLITDRRAGRIATELNEELVAKISANIKKIDDVEVKVYPGKEHRFVVVFSGSGLDDKILDADPEQVNVPQKFSEALTESSSKASDIANKFIKQMTDLLKDEKPANSCLLRGFAKIPPIASMRDRYGLKACAIASYPMYKGLSRLVGMDVIEGLTTLEDEIKVLKKEYENYDYFYFHVKKTDSYGEDGNRKSKVAVIEEFDKLLPQILELSPEVVCVTADHSTPTNMSGHSWHPNPVLVKGPHMRYDVGKVFDENECRKGNFGVFYAKDLMQMLLAQAGRLKKYGA